MSEPIATRYWQHPITRVGSHHDAECACGWWADGGRVALDHMIQQHLGVEPMPPCDKECCETAV